MNVLLLGKGGIDAEDAKTQLALGEQVRLFGGGSIDDVRSVFAHTPIDAVILGGGIAIELRLDIVREVFRLSDATSVHMKDIATGPGGYLPFVRKVLEGLTGT